MTVLTRKFSQFIPEAVDRVVGLTAGANAIGPNGGGGGSSGVTTVITQNNNFSVGQWVRFDVASDLYVLAKADTPLDAEVIGCVIAVSPPGGPPFTQFTLQQSGYVTIAQAVFPVLTPGQPQFLSDTILGAMVNVDVLIDGEVSRPVFIPDKTDGTHSSGWVLPYRGIIAGGGPDTGIPGPTPPGGTDTNITTVVQNNHGLNAGDWIRVTTPQAGPQVQYIRAIADNLADSQSIGVVIQVIDVNTFRVQFAGYVATDITTNTTAPFEDAALAVLVPSTVYYLSGTVAGQITSVDPGLTTGGFSKPLFVSEQTIGTVNRNAGWILPQRPLAAASSNNPLQRTITQIGHGFTMIGTIVKPSTTVAGAYVAAIATSFIPSYGTAMIVSIPDVDHFVLQEVGYVTGLDIAPPVPGGIANTALPGGLPFAIGQPYYLSTSNAPVSGQMTTVEPTPPNFSKPVFMPDQTNAGWILPMKPTLGHGGGGGGGGIIQVLDFVDSVQHSISYSTAKVPLPWITGTITPSNVNSKIRITIMLHIANQFPAGLTLTRNGVEIGLGTQPGAIPLTAYAHPVTLPQTSGMNNIFIMYVDSPASILPLTYGLLIGPWTTLVSASFNTAGLVPNGCPLTTWTLEEIA